VAAGRTTAGESASGTGSVGKIRRSGNAAATISQGPNLASPYGPADPKLGGEREWRNWQPRQV
jgi:hypothetical protein